jgi:hypothetical protein
MASTDEGNVSFAAAVAVGVVTGDTEASITGGSVTAWAGQFPKSLWLGLLRPLWLSCVRRRGIDVGS